MPQPIPRPRTSILGVAAAHQSWQPKWPERQARMESRTESAPVSRRQSRAPRSSGLLRNDHVIDIYIGGELPAVSEQIVDHAGLGNEAQAALLDGDFKLIWGDEFVPLMRS